MNLDVDFYALHERGLTDVGAYTRDQEYIYDNAVHIIEYDTKGELESISPNRSLSQGDSYGYWTIMDKRTETISILSRFRFFRNKIFNLVYGGNRAKIEDICSREEAELRQDTTSKHMPLEEINYYLTKKRQ